MRIGTASVAGANIRVSAPVAQVVGKWDAARSNERVRFPRRGERDEKGRRAYKDSAASCRVAGRWKNLA